jgi:hypothetical protein
MEKKYLFPKWFNRLSTAISCSHKQITDEFCREKIIIKEKEIVKMKEMKKSS